MQMQAAEKFAKKREQVRLAAQEMGRKAKEKEAALEKARANRACAHYVRKTVARAISLAVGKAAVRLTWQEAEARKQKFVQLVEPEEEAEAEEEPFYAATIDVTEDGTYVVTTEPPAAEEPPISKEDEEEEEDLRELDVTPYRQPPPPKPSMQQHEEDQKERLRLLTERTEAVAASTAALAAGLPRRLHDRVVQR